MPDVFTMFLNKDDDDQTPGGGGVLWISSDRDGQSIFFVFEIFGKPFFGRLDLTRDIFGYSKQSEDSW